jgi:hypothetical protein
MACGLRHRHAQGLWLRHAGAGESATRSYLLKVLWWDGQGLLVYEAAGEGRFVWPSPADGAGCSVLRSLACCWKASIGGCRCARSGHRPPDTGLLFELCRAAVSPSIRSWITNHGGFGPRTTLLKGCELTALYPICE